MSTFPEHKDNIKNLKELGFNVSDYIKDGQATLESYNNDELVFLISEIVEQLKKQDFKAGK